MSYPVSAQAQHESQSQVSGECVTNNVCLLLCHCDLFLWYFNGHVCNSYNADNSIMEDSDQMEDQVGTCIENLCSKAVEHVALNTPGRHVLRRTYNLHKYLSDSNSE
jgi:hypothetical protein